MIMTAMRNLLTMIEDAVPLINLAITTSGVNLSTSLPSTVSPSRLLQANTLLNTADVCYNGGQKSRVQVGPDYVLSMYMLFAGHSTRPPSDEATRITTWKEVIHKARVKLVRLPISQVYNTPGPAGSDVGGHTHSQKTRADQPIDEFSYQLLIIEDLDDDRVHTLDIPAPPGPLEDVAYAGMRDVIPIHQVSKIFYADTGKILNIGTDSETNNPVLLLKRDIYAPPPRRMMERHDSTGSDPISDHRSDSNENEQEQIDAQIRRESSVIRHTNDSQDLSSASQGSKSWGFPSDLDPEWIAFEVYSESVDTDSDEGASTTGVDDERLHQNEGVLTNEHSDKGLSRSFCEMSIGSPPESTEEPQNPIPLQKQTSTPVRTSLSLLEMLIRLTALQQFRQASHLTIEDELLNFFLADSSTTGAGSNSDYRQRVRRDARLRIGFDPYDESPFKQRGEEYISHAPTSNHIQGQHSGSMSLSSPGIESYLNGNDPYQHSSPSPLPPHPRPMPSTVHSSPGPITPAPRRGSLGVNRHSMRPSLRSTGIQNALRFKEEAEKRDSAVGVRSKCRQSESD